MTATPSALPSHCTLPTTPPAMPALASGTVPTARATSRLITTPKAQPVNSSAGSSGPQRLVQLDLHGDQQPAGGERPGTEGERLVAPALEAHARAERGGDEADRHRG